MRVRTGFERIVAHRSNETFACPAQRDGVVLKVDHKLGIVKVKYDPIKPVSTGQLQTNFSSNDIRHHFEQQQPLTVVKPAKDDLFHVGQIVTVNKLVDLQVSSILIYNSRSEIPDPENYNKRDLDAVKDSHAHVITLSVPTERLRDSIDVFQFGDKYANISGSYLKQSVVLNVKEGDRVKRGDILAYNEGFFELDQDNPQQVTWKHGVPANVVFMEVDETYEDSNAISPEFSERMAMHPAHMRTIRLTKNTILHSIVNVGDHVQTTDYLCVIEDSDIDALTLSDDPATIEFLTNLNRKAPKAKYHGTIATIDVVYSCPLDDMHPTVRALVDKIDAPKAKLARETANTLKASKFAAPMEMHPNTRYMEVDIDENTIVVLICITDKINQRNSDKLVVANALKSISCRVYEKPILTESGLPIDVVFSGKSVQNRIVVSPLLAGSLERVLEKLEERALDTYFNG